MLSHGEESGRDAAEMSEAPRPTEEDGEIVFAGRQGDDDGEDDTRRRSIKETRECQTFEVQTG